MFKFTNSKVNEFDFSFEKARVDLFPKCILGNGKLELFPDAAAIHFVIGLEQAENDLFSAFEDLPNVRTPASIMRKIASVKDKGKAVSRSASSIYDLSA